MLSVRTGYLRKDGYRAFEINGVEILEHVWVAEKALGKSLPKGSEVHHVNEVKSDNRGANLVISPNKAYHRLLHVRQDALNKSGNANYRKCWFCKEYGDTALMYVQKRKSAVHKSCFKQYVSNRNT